MRVAVLGQGSIGRRHAQLALVLGHEVTACDLDPRRMPPHGARIAESVRDCLEGADAAIVASPSSEHFAHAHAAIEAGVPVLVEKPLALDAAHAAELDRLARERGSLLSVAMNLREHPGVRTLARLVADGQAGDILHARAHCGSWLPSWRPGSDYRESYSARRELGGGVLLDVATHELDYLLWILGPVRTVSALATRASELEIDVEDVALIVLELECGAVAEVAVDYLDRSYTRGCRIVGSLATLRWNWEEQRLTRHAADGATDAQTLPSDVAPTYRAQLERFLAAARVGGPAPVPAADARAVLAVIDAARISSREGRRVAPAPPIALRAAGAQDGARLLQWRNDPDTRRFSRSSREIAPAEHERWLQLVLADRTKRLWIAEHDGRPVAHVRVEADRDGIAELHVVVAEQERGRGVGAAALAQAAARALCEPDLTLLRAYVKPDNAASLSTFARAGFRRTGTDDEGLVRLERAESASPVGP